MVNFDVEDGQDPENIHPKLSSITLEFDHLDLPYWFSQAEMQMEICGIKSQWIKRIVLQRLLLKTSSHKYQRAIVKEQDRGR